MNKKLVILTASLFLLLAFISAQEKNIIDAAKSGETSKVKSLLQKNPKLINTVDGGLGATALHWACIYGRKEVTAAPLRYFFYTA